MTEVDEFDKIARATISALDDDILSCREQIQSLLEKNAQNMRTRALWEVMVQAKKDKELTSKSVLAALSRAGGSSRFAIDSEVARTVGDENYGSKMALVRQLLGVAAKDGVTPKELGDMLENAGARVSSSFAGNALHRLKARNDVVFHEGRYYLPMYAPATLPGYRDFQDQTHGTMLQALIALVDQQKAIYASLPEEEQGDAKPLLNELIASTNAANKAYLAFHAETGTFEAAKNALEEAWKVVGQSMIKGPPK